MSTRFTNRQRPCGTLRGAFTLIEIMVVVIIIAILAAIVVPQFSNAAAGARANTLKDDLRYMRSQIVAYEAQHRDVPPGYTGGSANGTPTASAFVDQMTLYTDDSGNTSATTSAVYCYGPYLPRIPINPMSNLSTVTIVAAGQSIPTPDNSSGWFYKPDTMEVYANSTGTDDSGAAYSSY